MDDEGDSLNRALADIEMLQAAYPDEVSVDDNLNTTTFPLHCSLHLSQDSFVELEFTEGYPITTGVQVSKYRSPHKARMDSVVTAIRQASSKCLADQVEGGFACCAAAIDAWNEFEATETTTTQQQQDGNEEIQQQPQPTTPPVEWITGEALVDRKSSFVARACRVTSEQQVHEALHHLISQNSKLQRATHNMYAYRVSEELPNGTVVNKFDNDDDGEHGSGKCLAHLLEMRDETNVLVLVSRWYGGVHLGPKRFAHITNTARELLVACHENEWNES